MALWCGARALAYSRVLCWLESRARGSAAGSSSVVALPQLASSAGAEQAHAGTRRGGQHRCIPVAPASSRSGPVDAADGGSADGVSNSSIVGWSTFAGVSDEADESCCSWGERRRVAGESLLALSVRRERTRADSAEESADHRHPVGPEYTDARMH